MVLLQTPPRRYLLLEWPNCMPALSRSPTRQQHKLHLEKFYNCTEIRIWIWIWNTREEKQPKQKRVITSKLNRSRKHRKKIKHFGISTTTQTVTIGSRQIKLFCSYKWSRGNFLNLNRSDKELEFERKLGGESIQVDPAWKIKKRLPKCERGRDCWITRIKFEILRIFHLLMKIKLKRGGREEATAHNTQNTIRVAC